MSSMAPALTPRPSAQPHASSSMVAFSRSMLQQQARGRLGLPWQPKCREHQGASSVGGDASKRAGREGASIMWRDGGERR